MSLICHLSSFSQKNCISDLLSFLSQFFEAVKELHNFPFPILIYTIIGKYKIRIINFGSRTNLYLLFVGQYVRKNICQCLSMIIAKPHSSMIFQKQHSICRHIFNKSEQGEKIDLKCFKLSCYALVKPNKSVHPILTIGIVDLRNNSTHRKIK